MSFEEKIKPIKLTIGTTVDEETARGTVFGRENLVAELWDKLRTSSISLIGERRTGKTWVLRLAQALQPTWAETLWFDAEVAHSAAEFVNRLNRVLYQGLLSKKKIKKVVNGVRRAAQRIEKIKGTVELKHLDRWSSFLVSTVKDFTQHAGSKKAVLLIDELPLSVQSISHNRAPEEATQLLDELRALRMANPSLRMVFCGSLGMHVVLQELEGSGYKGRPTNDLVPFDVPPLSERDSLLFAAGLLVGEEIGFSDLEQVSQAVSSAGSRVPYYIQQVVGHMKDQEPREFSPEEAYAIPEKLFQAPGDPAHMRDHDERLTSYYPEDICEKARAVLDVLSNEPMGLDDPSLLNLVRYHPKTVALDPESLQVVLRILQDDHYLEKTNGKWRFTLSIIQRWWAATRVGG